MKKQNRVILGVILIAILLMGIGYALGATELTISGTAKASENQENFKVYFTGANTKIDPVQSENENIKVTVGDITKGATEATVDVEGLTTKNETASVILEIENGSDDIDASSIDVTAATADTAYFDVEAIMCDASGAAITNYEVKSKAKTYVKVSVKLLKNPTQEVSTDITVTIKADPKIV